MARPSLEVECLEQLRDYIKSLGGELEGEWKCRAQVRDYGSRAGSVDTWFTAPTGEVYRSKVAAARGIGLDPSKGTNTKRPKAPRKSSTRGAANGGTSDNGEETDGGGDGEGGEKSGAAGGEKSEKKDNNNKSAAAKNAGATSNEQLKWALNPSSGSKPVELTLNEIGEILMSMPEATDCDDCYEGPLFYKEAQLRHAARMAARAAAAAAAAQEAADLAAAEAASLAEAEAKAKRDAERRARAAEREQKLLAERLAREARDGGSGEDNDSAGAAADGDADGDVEMKDAAAEGDQDAIDGGDKDAGPSSQGDKETATGTNAGAPSGDQNDNEQEEEQEEEEEEEEEELPDLNGRSRNSRRNTRHSLAMAVAAAAALLQEQSGSQLPASVASMAADAAGFFEDGSGNQDGDDNVNGVSGGGAAAAIGPPQLDQWDVEIEVIRKCFVKVPVRLGRPSEDEPVPLSPTSRDANLTDALLALSDGELNGANGASAKDCPRENAASIADWQLKRFPLDQLTANDGEPSALHPAALFYLRHLEEEIDAEERALRREAEERAARKEAKRLEKLNQVGEDGKPRPALPKPANLSLRGKSIEEVEAALMERLATYVTDLGGHLPDGWRVKASIRQNGANAGGVDAYYYDPTGRRHKSMVKVAEILGLEATAAAKPKTLASILGTGGKRNKKGEAAMGAASGAEGGEGGEGGTVGEGAEGGNGEGAAVAAAGDGQQQQQQDGTGGATDSAVRATSPPVDPSDPGSARKTCGTCRTCLNPQLKKGCLANKAKKGTDRSRSRSSKKQQPTEDEDSPSPTPPPPKRLTARQLAKIERLERERAEKEAARLALEAAEAAEAEEEAAEAAAAEAAAQEEAADQPAGALLPPRTQTTSADEDAPIDIGSFPPVVTQLKAAEAGAAHAVHAEAMDVDIMPPADNTTEAPGAGAGGPSKSSAGQKGAASGGSGGGTKRSRSEATAGGGGGGGDAGSDDDDDDGDDKKRPKREDGDGHGADDGVAHYPRRHRKQVKDPFKPSAGDDEETKKKKEAEKAARREKRKLRDNEVVRNVYDRAYNRLKGQLSRLRQEQALVEAYAADGWRGASREKVKPVAEIKRAKEQIQRCKEVIRECVKVVDEAEGDKSIPAELFDSDGELDLDHIFCAKCRGNESTDDNDIILCDGHCDRAYHVKCLVPPVDPATLPEDEGWLCPSCDRKIDMIDDINDEFGTEYEYDTPWEQVLAPGTLPVSPQNAAAAGEGGGPGSPRGAPVDLDRLEGLLAGADLPSDDEEDEDYAVSGSDSEEDAAEKESGDGGDDKEEEQSGPSSGQRSTDSGSESDDDTSSLASEDLGGEILDVELTEEERAALAQRYAMVDSSDDDSDGKLIVQGKRRRTAVDYRALNQEIFGDDGTPVAAGLVSENEEDEDEGWSPRAAAKKERARKRRKKDEEESEEESEESDSDSAVNDGEESGEEEEEGSGEEEQEQEEEGDGEGEKVEEEDAEMAAVELKKGEEEAGPAAADE